MYFSWPDGTKKQHWISAERLKEYQITLLSLWVTCCMTLVSIWTQLSHVMTYYDHVWALVCFFKGQGRAKILKAKACLLGRSLCFAALTCMCENRWPNSLWKRSQRDHFSGDEKDHGGRQKWPVVDSSKVLRHSDPKVHGRALLWQSKRAVSVNVFLCSAHLFVARQR